MGSRLNGPPVTRPLDQPALAILVTITWHRTTSLPQSHAADNRVPVRSSLASCPSCHGCTTQSSHLYITLRSSHRKVDFCRGTLHFGGSWRPSPQVGQAPSPLDFGQLIRQNYSISIGSHRRAIAVESDQRTEASNPARNRGIGHLKGAKRSPLTKWKSWKSWAKVTKAVIGCPSECQKQRDFQGGLDFDEKRGVAGGVKKCKILGEYAVQSGQRRSVWSAFWSKLREFGRICVRSHRIRARM